MDSAAATALLRQALDDERRALATGELDAPVPSCPGWTLHDLAAHLVDNLRWVHGAIAEGHPDTVSPPAPRSRGPLLERFDEAAAALLDLLGRTAPDAPCWTFGRRPGTAAFWFRRLVHEHTVHAVDALTAVGVPRPVDPAVALDGLDEIVDLFFPRQVRLGRIAPLARSLAIEPEQGPRRVLAGDGRHAPGAADEVADAVVGGPAEALYLLLWHRIGLTDPRLRLAGDLDAARQVLGEAVVP